jgi:hypothetical protein
MSDIKKGDSKPRCCVGNEPSDKEYEPKDCADSGGKYQELKTLGSFASLLPGSQDQRRTDNNYCKVYLEKKEKKESLVDMIKEDTGGPPFDNVSRPKRVF